jgi:hypothetical protein
MRVKKPWQPCGSGKRRLADGDTHAVEAIGKLRLALPMAIGTAATQGAPWWKTGLAAKFAQTRFCRRAILSLKSPLRLIIKIGL